LGYIGAGKDAMMKKTAEIEPLKKDPRQYDTVFIGQPVWAFTMVPAIRALFKRYDFSGKKIALFCTMDGSGDKRLFSETMKSLLDCEIINRKAFIKPLQNKEKAQNAVEEFMAKIK